MKEKVIYLPIGILTSATLLSGAVLASGGVAATTTATCTTTNGVTTCSGTGEAPVEANPSAVTATVTVASACGFTAGGATSSIELSAGETKNTESDTKTAMVVSCNDANGFSIYAIGSSPATAGGSATDGQTHLIGTSGTIDSQAASSATGSYWAMKVTSVTSVASSGSATIQNSYGTAYLAVPSSQTEIVRVPGMTSGLSAATVRTDYQVYATRLQPAGTYEGGVKYTVTHPNGTAPTA
ncbi:hypothetical protein IJG90_02360 [Candidatus Saccharibacteria bacterium]|nr:hypothetical protein [Candidatus Saccharibacteria bacterium]